MLNVDITKKKQMTSNVPWSC